jgi:hypothetical protein
MRESENTQSPRLSFCALLASGGVYSAFAVGTVYADSLDILLVQDNASAGATASTSASASASAASASADDSLPHTGGGTWLPSTVAIVLACSGVVALVLVRCVTAS